MAEFPAMPFWTDAYLSDTTHLTTLEHGAYLLLLFSAWRSKDGFLPDDDKMLARFSGLSGAQWSRIKPIIEKFFIIENGHWIQPRLIDERNAVKQNSKRQSFKAKARWLKTKETDNATAMPRECRNDASLTLPLPPSTPIVPKGTDVDFTSWYEKYPNKIGKAAARSAFDKAIKKTKLENLISGLEKYIKTKPHDRPWCNPATWLNQERWEDAPMHASQTPAKKQSSDENREILMEAINGP